MCRFKERIRDLQERIRNVKGTKCEVYSRIVGYFSPTSQWNTGKKAEFKERHTYGTGRRAGGRSE